MKGTSVSRRLSYVLPLRWNDDSGLDELTDYLRWLAERCQVVVADGSPEPHFTRHAQRWNRWVTHLRVPTVTGASNGKVVGVCHGVRVAVHDRVVIADDDVRYDDTALRRVGEVLDSSDLVVPQNYFGALPWHARWDTARTLLNRAFSGDYPGTFGVSRTTFLAMGGYRDDVLFENLELMRTLAVAGGRIARAPDLFVRRTPPTARHFWSQRVRQAYDSLAQPVRCCVELAVLPAVGVAIARNSTAKVTSFLALSGVLVAELGRRRHGGTQVFPATTAVFAPLWIAERAVCVWIALARRVLLGGVRYHGGRLPTAAHSKRWLSKRRASRPGDGSALTSPDGARPVHSGCRPAPR
ncbi:hypothetical protein BN6_53180 [Saccharothrix espanaensis DSM 44229]|uniref:Glycosyltransferase, family 2 n=1 Tax=Saccharothrix espanaensis (strain ATCC 51144 / DSM 44229 / JCM 9112 / NBRC 15066 / NRRL 15764) TaxID=1179773 RepID=K0K4T5_SACES|nr:hypothetical protein BN6_53180 [Saccharothrix espanaensis DSM 44229]